MYIIDKALGWINMKYNLVTYILIQNMCLCIFWELKDVQLTSNGIPTLVFPCTLLVNLYALTLNSMENVCRSMLWFVSMDRLVSGLSETHPYKRYQ